VSVFAELLADWDVVSYPSIARFLCLGYPFLAIPFPSFSPFSHTRLGVIAFFSYDYLN
jgi:hypothetical protein